MEIKSIEELKEALTINKLLEGNGEDIQSVLKKHFRSIAEFLLTETEILKGKKRYFITDVEFYFYSNEHRDIITYPRKCNAGEWFFHPSGVDISFESNVESKVNNNGILKACLREDSVFGGILLRSISQASPEEFENDAKIKLNGPLKLMYTLFDKFNAFECPYDFPMLKKCENPHGSKDNVISESRHNLLTANKSSEQKVNSILSNYYNREKINAHQYTEEFDKFLKAPYRFVLSDK